LKPGGGGPGLGGSGAGFEGSSGGRGGGPGLGGGLMFGGGSFGLAAGGGLKFGGGGSLGPEGPESFGGGGGGGGRRVRAGRPPAQMGSRICATAKGSSRVCIPKSPRAKTTKNAAR